MARSIQMQHPFSRLLACPILLAGCTQLEILSSDEPDAAVPARVQQALDTQCATAGCHAGTPGAGGLSLEAGQAASAIDGASSQSPLPLITLGDINRSYLAIKMLATVPEGVERVMARMPLNGDPTDPDNAIILGWIAGAEFEGGAAGTETGGPAPGSGSSGDDGGSSGDDAAVSCSTEDVVVGAATTLDAGDQAGQIPTEVGTALSANCGCHYGSELVEGAPGFAVPMASVADFQEQVGDPARPRYEQVAERIDSGSMPPAYYCNLGDGTAISQADVDTLTQWLADGAMGNP